MAKFASGKRLRSHRFNHSSDPRTIRGLSTVGKNRVDETLSNVILIVDDQPNDLEALTRALRKFDVENPILCLNDGDEAIRYYNGTGKYSDRSKYPLPSILFLDLKLRTVSGWEVLDWIHGLGMKQKSNIFVYTQLSTVNEVHRLYNLGADSFIHKPVQEDDLTNLIRHFPNFWAITQPPLAR